MVVFTVVVRISDPAQVQFSGEIVGESAMSSEVDVGSQVIHRYQVVSISCSPLTSESFMSTVS